MNELVKQLQDVIDKKVDNNDIKIELSKLTKMLKIGFEKKTSGMEKVPKTFASNDTKKIMKSYDVIANQINALKVSGSFDKFNEYLKINYGITVNFSSEDAPSNKYISTPKKYKKFNDLYTEYFLEELPKHPNDAIEKILKSLTALNKEFSNENDGVKELLKEIIEKQNEHSPLTIKTVDKILTNARLKTTNVEEVANALDEHLTLQSQGIEIVLKSGE